MQDFNEHLTQWADEHYLEHYLQYNLLKQKLLAVEEEAEHAGIIFFKHDHVEPAKNAFENEQLLKDHIVSLSVLFHLIKQVLYLEGCHGSTIL
jgi:hypothetical protein